MSDCVDDTAPLLQPFVRGSSLRTPLRWHRAATPDLCPQTLHGPSCKPPLPPRPAEYSRRPLLRSLSVNDGREAADTRIPCRVQQVHSGADEWRAPRPHQPLCRPHIASAAGDGAAPHPRRAQSPACGAGEGSHSRYGFQFSSMPRLKRTPPASPELRRVGMSSFLKEPSSPFLGRRAAQPAEEGTSTKKERPSYESKPSTFSDNSFLRRLCSRSGRSQTPPPPPCSSPLRSPITYRREAPAAPLSPGTFRRHGSVPMQRPTGLPPHQSVGESGGGGKDRSSSFRHPRHRYSALASHLPVLSPASGHVPDHHSDKYPLLHDNTQRYSTPDDRKSCGWRARTPPLPRRDVSLALNDWHHSAATERRNPRRFSYLRQPLTTYGGGGGDTKQPSQGHVAATPAADLTTTATTTTTTTTTPSSPTTTTTTTAATACSSPPCGSHRPAGSLDIDDRSPPPGSRAKGQGDDAAGGDAAGGGGTRLSRLGSPPLNLSRVSSDSGYSTCSNSSSSSSNAVVSRSDSVMSDGEGDMIAWFGSRLNLREEECLAASTSATDHFSYLLGKEEEYLACLDSMLRDYRDMTSRTPSLIRQHFDLIFRQVEVIHAFQTVLQDDLRQTRGRPLLLARVFTNEQFQCYGRYMVMTPAVQRDLLQYASHFKEHFPDLKRNILKPSLRINFYAMILETFKKEASPEVKGELQAAIDFLNQVKRKANTEMTLSTVTHSPVDLRLGGDMLHIGELLCTSGGGLLQKKKYQVILFENLLVITSLKTPYFKYKTHLRVEQLESVEVSGEAELLLNVLSGGHTQLSTLRFRVKGHKARDEWVSELQKITRRNTKLSQGRGSVSLLQIPRQQFRTLPLDLFLVFPLLREAVADDAAPEPSTDPLDGYSLTNMICYEQMYVDKLSSLLNPEIQRPPEPLSDLLEQLHRLHSRHFLPALQRSHRVADFLEYLADNLDQLSLYIEYLVTRAQLTVKLDDVPQAGPYISPVQHVYGIYLGLVKELSGAERCRRTAQRVMKRLWADIRAAQLRVLKEAIVNGRVDFERSGGLLLYSPLEVKARKKDLRAGEYVVLLFENVIILTKPRQPYYEYVMDIWLDQVNLGPPASHDCTFRVEVRQGGRKEPITYEMCASSVEVKQEWHRRLHRQMLVQVEKIRERVASVGEAAGGAAR